MLSLSSKPSLHGTASASATEVGAASLRLANKGAFTTAERMWGVGRLCLRFGGHFGMGAKEPPLFEGHIHRGKGVTNDKVAIDVFQVSGSVRWFDPSKGYGFLVPDQDLPDVLLHVTCFRRDGFQTAREGSRIVCDVIRTAKGLQAVRIYAMDTSTAVHPLQLPQRTHVVVVPESDWERATVRWFNRSRGFGFLTRGADTADIFVHTETIRRCGFIELRPGQTVLVRYGRGPAGLIAAELSSGNTAGPSPMDSAS
jgi:CspA family cold shock protein